MVSDCTVADCGTVVQYLRRTARARPDAVSLRWRDGSGGYDEWTWAEYAERACRVARGLAGIGVRRGERVVLMLDNEPAFHLADTASMLAGCTPVSVYNSAAPNQIAYVADHCGASTAVVSVRYLPAFLRARKEMSTLRRLVVVGDGGDRPLDAIAFDQLLAAEPIDLDDAVRRVTPDDLATLVYTSGTTGRPKGVMIRHRNICASLDNWLGALGSEMTGWRLISYMPMAHIAERTLFSHYMHLREGTEVTTCDQLALFDDYLLDVRPDFAYLPPRLLEKMRSSIFAGLDEAERTELDVLLEASCTDPGHPLLERIRVRLGLDRCRVLLTGAAPISPDVFAFFVALGLPLSECYGMTECCGGATWSPGDPRPGTVGRALPGVEIRLADEDAGTNGAGEVLLRGRNVVTGYLDNPEANAELFDDDGWLRTGDVGVFDDDGYLRIVDRKKDIIITAGGLNVSPVSVENELKAHRLVAAACVAGDGRRYLVALLVLDVAEAAGWATANGHPVTDADELARLPSLRAELERWVGQVNEKFARPEQVKRFHLVTGEWGTETGELTPTLKLRRRAVLDKYAREIDQLYAPSSE
jgi:long-chain acyl-CoA synthetase